MSVRVHSSGEHGGKGKGQPQWQAWVMGEHHLAAKSAKILTQALPASND